MAATAIPGAPRPTPAWRLKANALWRWWTGELSQLVPERFAGFGRGDRAPMLAIRDGEASIADARPGITSHRSAIGSLEPAQRRTAVRTLLEGAGEQRGRARATLGSDEALVRRVTMPLATEENLRQVLEFEMDRLTPFRADEVYYDYRIVSRDSAAGQLVIQVVVARREVVDARVRELRDLGVSVQGVAIREDAGTANVPFDLLPNEQRGERESSRERFVQRVAVGIVLVLLFVALVYPVYQKRETFIALNPLVIQARHEAEATDGLARELERQVADYNYLLARKHGTQPALAFIEEMSRLLPDNTWVQQLDVKTVGKTREVQISGETASASKLIEILEGSTLLQNAAFRGNVSRGTQTGTERFLISAEVRPRAQPESRSVFEMVSLTPPAPMPPAPLPPASGPAPSPPATVTPVPAPAQQQPATAWPRPGGSK
ncbi:MAG TPA: PilN domain-containing protein [Usitatibacter sp.]